MSPPSRTGRGSGGVPWMTSCPHWPFSVEHLEVLRKLGVGVAPGVVVPRLFRDGWLRLAGHVQLGNRLSRDGATVTSAPGRWLLGAVT
jgi:hypothetical protein